MKVREERYLELQRFIHSKKLTGSFDDGKAYLLEMLSKEDMQDWTKKNDQFKNLLLHEIDVIFKEPNRILKAFEEEGSGLPQEETELLDLLASKVVEG